MPEKRKVLDQKDMEHLFKGGSLVIPGHAEIAIADLGWDFLHRLLLDCEEGGEHRLGSAKIVNQDVVRVEKSI